MRLIKLLESSNLMLNQQIKEQVLADHGSLEITGISNDSRKVEPGHLFVAIDGTDAKGTDFIEQAVKKGATAILAPTGTKFSKIISDQNIATFESTDTSKDLSVIARSFYPNQPENLYAVTGTNGKTSVALFVQQLLKLKGKKSASLGTMGFKSDEASFETGLTTTDSIQLHKIMHEAHAQSITDMALEASSHGLSQARLDGLTIKQAAFTNLSQDHLDYHETMDDYFEAKSRLFTTLLDKDGTAIINSDSSWGTKLINKCHDINVNVKTFGFNGQDIKVLKQTPHNKGQDLTVEIEGMTHDVTLNLIGDFQMMNALCAFLLASLSVEDLNLLSQLAGVEGRVEWVGTTKKGMDVFIDYAHTPDALETVLKAVRPHTNNQLWCLYGCGGNRDATKRPLMGQAAHNYSDHIILTDDNPRFEDPQFIRQQAKVGSPDAVEIGDRQDAIAYGLQNGQSGDVFMICGKGHERGQMIKDTSLPFHDGDIVKQLLKQY